MSAPFADSMYDLAVDRAIKKAEDLKIDDDLFIDYLADEELEKIIEESDDGY
tara:strand:- start:277 stop:432 length:156 start_codon:yes stop_codon:yes gene_type:complete